MYRKISSLGTTECDKQCIEDNFYSNPLSYCSLGDMSNSFFHGTSGSNTNLSSAYGRNCQSFMSDYCATNWDTICENMSNKQDMVIDQLNTCRGVKYINYGDLLIRNTAIKKYQTNMDECGIRYETFDPLSYIDHKIRIIGQSCTPVYDIDTDTVVGDAVLNKLLDRPHVGMDILKGIYDSLKISGRYDKIKGTRLGKFYTIYFEKI